MSENKNNGGETRRPETGADQASANTAGKPRSFSDQTGKGKGATSDRIATDNRPPRPFDQKRDSARKPRPYDDKKSAGEGSQSFAEKTGSARSARPYGEKPSNTPDPRPYGEKPGNTRDPRPYGEKDNHGGPKRMFDKKSGAAGAARSSDQRTRSGGSAAARIHGVPRSSSNPNASTAVATVSADELKVGDTIVVSIKRLGVSGEGVGFFRGKTVFVAGALPDETVKARVTAQQPTMIEATAVHIEKASPFRIKPDCPVYESCGGCQLQHMSYEGQLRAKEDMVREAFERHAEGVRADIRPIAGLEHPWAYRTKANLQVGVKGRSVVTGLYSTRSHQLVDTSGCLIQHPELNRVMEEVRGIIERLGIRIYNEKDKTGSIRTLVARSAVASGKVQLTLVTATDSLPLRDRLIKQIRGALPHVVTIAQNVNPGLSSLSFGHVTRILWGRELLDEALGEVKHSLSPQAFFPLNPEQSVRLYDFVREAAALSGTELVVDAYCGIGTIGLWLAPYAREVRGIESAKDAAAANARHNVEQSGLCNVRIYEGRAEGLLPQWFREGLRPDVIIVDPPRNGCDPALLTAIADAKPPRLVYVSSNLSTMAKDIKTLAESGYRLEWVQPVDMFPQTSQVECSVLLKWAGE